MSPPEMVAALAVALMRGLQFVTSKLGVASLPPLLFVALRFALRGAAAALRGAATTPGPLAGRGTSVFFGSLCFGLFFTGLALGSAGLSAALTQLITPFTLMFALPVAGERPRLYALLGTVIAFAGIAVVFVKPNCGTSPVAALLVSGGAAFQGFGTALLRRLDQSRRCGS